MNSNAAFLPGLILIVCSLISAVHHTSPNKELFGWGTGKMYVKPGNEENNLIRRRMEGILEDMKEVRGRWDEAAMMAKVSEVEERRRKNDGGGSTIAE